MFNYTMFKDIFGSFQNSTFSWKNSKFENFVLFCLLNVASLWYYETVCHVTEDIFINLVMNFFL